MNFNFISYMHTIAQNLKEVAWDPDDASAKKFFRISSMANMDELIQGLASASAPCIVVEDISAGRFTDIVSRNLHDNRTYSFMVLDKVPPADYATMATVRQSTYALCIKILSRMMRDYNLDNRVPATRIGLRNMDWSSVYYQFVGPLGDNLYGYMVQFTVLNSLNPEIQYNPSHWLDEPLS